MIVNHALPCRAPTTLNSGGYIPDYLKSEQFKMVVGLDCSINFVVYFDQLLGAAHTQKLVETFFSAVFQSLQTVIVDFRREITGKGLK